MKFSTALVIFTSALATAAWELHVDGKTIRGDAPKSCSAVRAARGLPVRWVQEPFEGLFEGALNPEHRIRPDAAEGRRNRTAENGHAAPLMMNRPGLIPQGKQHELPRMRGAASASSSATAHQRASSATAHQRATTATTRLRPTAAAHQHELPRMRGVADSSSSTSTTARQHASSMSPAKQHATPSMSMSMPMPMPKAGKQRASLSIAKQHASPMPMAGKEHGSFIPKAAGQRGALSAARQHAQPTAMAGRPNVGKLPAAPSASSRPEHLARPGAADMPAERPCCVHLYERANCEGRVEVQCRSSIDIARFDADSFSVTC